MINKNSNQRLIKRLVFKPKSLARCISTFGRELKTSIKAKAIHKKYAKFTMISPHTFVSNLNLALSIQNIPGCVIECGVWRGGMIAGIAEVLGADRSYMLFDSFQGLPPAKEIDGSAAIAWQSSTDSSTYYDNCTAEREFAERAMAMSGAKKVSFYPGWFNDTLRSFVPPAPIALLRLDGDWYDSTMTCLSALFPYVASGGLVILDDYMTWDGCSRAVHDYLSKNKAAARITQWDNDVVYIKAP